jgi:hypothetical protein
MYNVILRCVRVISNHCCCGKAISVIYSERVSAALLLSMSRACALYTVVICDLSGSTTFSHLSQRRFDFIKGSIEH